MDDVGWTAGLSVGVPLTAEGDAVIVELVPLGVGGAVFPWGLLAPEGPWPPGWDGLDGWFCGDPSW